MEGRLRNGGEKLWKKNMQHETEREGEIWLCSFQGLAAFQAVWLWFWWPPVFLFCLTSGLTGPWNVPLPAWSKLQSSCHHPMFAAGWKKGRRASHMSFQLPYSRHSSDRKQVCELAGIWNGKQTLTSSRMSPAWEPASKNDVNFFFFFHSTTPELLWKSLSGNSTHFFVPVEVGRDWKHSLRDNGLSKTLKATPCSSQKWIRQQQVTQQLLQRCAWRKTLPTVSQPELSATPLWLNLNVIWWSES